MERCIGLDAHAASCTLAIISETGKRLRDFPVGTNGAALVEAIRAIPGPLADKRFQPRFSKLR